MQHNELRRVDPTPQQTGVAVSTAVPAFAGNFVSDVVMWTDTQK